jgi:hypothetical protein
MMSQPRRNILLLTATISPNPIQANFALSNPGQRFLEYKTALAFYSGLLDEGLLDGIVFAENSGFDLKILATQFPSEKIEWLSYTDLRYPVGAHRGYGEFKLIDSAMSDASSLRALSDPDLIWKVSGRYLVKNLAGVVKRLKRSCDLYVDVRKNWAEMSVMAWSNRGYEAVIKGLYPCFASGPVPELTLAAKLHQLRDPSLLLQLNYVWPTWIVGRRGSDGSSYEGRVPRLRFFWNVSIIKIRMFRNLSFG